MIERMYYSEEELAAREKAVQEDLTHIFMKIGDIPISDILSNEFLQKNTNFRMFKEIQFSSMVWIDWNHEVVSTRRSLLDRFIAGSSRFETWDEMYQEALKEYEAKTGGSLCSECEHSGCGGKCHYGVYASDI